MALCVGVVWVLWSVGASARAGPRGAGSGTCVLAQRGEVRGGRGGGGALLLDSGCVRCWVSGRCVVSGVCKAGSRGTPACVARTLHTPPHTPTTQRTQLNTQQNAQEVSEADLSTPPRPPRTVRTVPLTRGARPHVRAAPDAALHRTSRRSLRSTSTMTSPSSSRATPRAAASR